MAAGANDKVTPLTCSLLPLSPFPATCCCAQLKSDMKDQMEATEQAAREAREEVRGGMQGGLG